MHIFPYLESKIVYNLKGEGWGFHATLRNLWTCTEKIIRVVMEILKKKKLNESDFDEYHRIYNLLYTRFMSEWYVCIIMVKWDKAYLKICNENNIRSWIESCTIVYINTHLYLCKCVVYAQKIRTFSSETNPFIETRPNSGNVYRVFFVTCLHVHVLGKFLWFFFCVHVPTCNVLNENNFLTYISWKKQCRLTDCWKHQSV